MIESLVSDMKEQKVMETLLSKKEQISLATQVCVLSFWDNFFQNCGLFTVACQFEIFRMCFPCNETFKMLPFALR